MPAVVLLPDQINFVAVACAVKVKIIHLPVIEAPFQHSSDHQDFEQRAAQWGGRDMGGRFDCQKECEEANVDKMLFVSLDQAVLLEELAGRRQNF